MAYFKSYLHQWFHGVDSMRTSVTDFLVTNQQAPVILTSEVDGRSLLFATEIEDLVKNNYTKGENGVYWPRQR